MDLRRVVDDQRVNWPRLQRLIGAVAVLAGLSGALGTAAAQGATVSTNWAGYVALPSTSAGSDFTSVSGTWQQPKATCSAGHETYSAAWVGLGGYNAGAKALEQVGADADCAQSGGATYKAWYELLPAAPINLKMKVRPGDEMSASVTVEGHGVTLRIRDLTSGARFTITKRAASVDRSSAEWIVEAPSVCVSEDSCQPLPLTNFGDVVFSSATATARGHTGTISDPAWSATALELQQSTFTGLGVGAVTRTTPTRTLIAATPSALTASSRGFSVSWQEDAVQIERPSAGTLPGFGGGPP
jgi:hypothetical protein